MNLFARHFGFSVRFSKQIGCLQPSLQGFDMHIGCLFQAGLDAGYRQGASGTPLLCEIQTILKRVAWHCEKLL